MDPKFLIFVLSNVTSHFSDKSEQGSEGDQNTSRVVGTSTRPDVGIDVIVCIFIKFAIFGLPIFGSIFNNTE